MAAGRRQVHQALHTDILGRVDPAYRAFHEEYLQYVVPSQLVPFDPAARNAPPMLGNTEPVQVGKQETISFLKCMGICWTPEGNPPANGWPVLLWFHGGGWALGSPAAEASWCTRACKNTPAVILSVDYRMAPEHPYPAAVDDCVDALQWTYDKGPARLKIDKSKIAVGGLSAGANLAAILAIKASELPSPIPLQCQLLVLGVFDNTATAQTYWKENADIAPFLTPARMTWYRNMYLPNLSDALNWDASPLYADEALLRHCPPAWLAVSELDILKPEALAYAAKLQKAGVPTTVKEYQGGTHSLMILPGVSARSREMVQDALNALQRTLASG